MHVRPGSALRVLQQSCKLASCAPSAGPSFARGGGRAGRAAAAAASHQHNVHVAAGPAGRHGLRRCVRVCLRGTGSQFCACRCRTGARTHTIVPPLDTAVHPVQTLPAATRSCATCLRSRTTARETSRPWRTCSRGASGSTHRTPRGHTGGALLISLAAVRSQRWAGAGHASSTAWRLLRAGGASA